MKNRKLKIIVDILMFLLLVFLLIPPSRIGVPFHIIGGIIFTSLVVTHICLNIKMFVSLVNASKTKKLNDKMKKQYVIDWLLVIVWSIAILSGFVAIGFAVGEMENLFIFSRIHNIAARLGFLFIIVHLFQHRKQIRSYIKRK